MRALGMLTTVVLVVGAAAAVAVGLMSRQDVKRYLKIRDM